MALNVSRKYGIAYSVSLKANSFQSKKSQRSWGGFIRFYSTLSPLLQARDDKSCVWPTTFSASFCGLMNWLIKDLASVRCVITAVIQSSTCSSLQPAVRVPAYPAQTVFKKSFQFIWIPKIHEMDVEWGVYYFSREYTPASGFLDGKWVLKVR